MVEEILRKIVSFGPRATGTPADRAAAEFLAAEFRRLNLAVSRQDFSASRLPQIIAGKVMPVLSMAVLIAAGLAFFSHPVLAVVLLAALLAQVPLVSLVGFKIGLHRRAAKVPTCNIIAEAGPFDPARPTLILAAHYDTKSQPVPFTVRMVCLLAPILLALVLLIAGIVTIVHGPVLSPAGVHGLIGATVVFLALQMASWNTNRSPGAIDNGSGVAILLALAAELPARLAARMNLVFLATGAEEMGLVGAIHFVDRFASRYDRNRTLVVNFDSLGTGGTVLMAASKIVKRSPIVAEVRDLLRRNGFRFRSLPFMIGAAMDHIPFARAGFAALSFTQASLKAGWHMHAATDDLEQIDLHELRNLQRLFHDLLVQPATSDRRPA